MSGFHVLHPMGWDAFGLPAEQHAIEDRRTSADQHAAEHQHVPPADQVARLQLRLGPRGRYHRPGLLQVDAVDLPAALRHLVRPRGQEGPADQRVADPARRQADGTRTRLRCIRTNTRLAYQAEVPVNWCPALGTVLANEEVIDGKSERGGHPVERRPLRQWMLRITAYAERLLDDLEPLDWSESIKEMQRNWIGKAKGRRSISRSQQKLITRTQKVCRVSTRNLDAHRQEDSCLHHPAGHAVRRDLHGAGAGASAGRQNH